MSHDFLAIAGSLLLLSVAALGTAVYLRRVGRAKRFLPRAEAVRRATEDALWGHSAGAMAIFLAMSLNWPGLFVAGIVFYSFWVVSTLLVQAKKIADLHKACEICDVGFK